jgi:hypothetical protein
MVGPGSRIDRVLSFGGVDLVFPWTRIDRVVARPGLDRVRADATADDEPERLGGLAQDPGLECASPLAADADAVQRVVFVAELDPQGRDPFGAGDRTEAVMPQASTWPLRGVSIGQLADVPGAPPPTQPAPASIAAPGSDTVTTTPVSLASATEKVTSFFSPGAAR